MALVLLPGGSDVAGKAVKVILPLAGEVLFQLQKFCVRKKYIFISAISGGGRFSGLMRVGFPSVSWSENCTTGIGGTFTYRRLAAEKPVRLRSSSPAASSSFSAPFMVVQPLSSISAISAMG